MKRRAIALTNSRVLDELCDLLIPELEERLANHLPSSQIEYSACVTTGLGSMSE
jgi:hypothetical protein